MMQSEERAVSVSVPEPVPAPVPVPVPAPAPAPTSSKPTCAPEILRADPRQRLFHSSGPVAHFAGASGPIRERAKVVIIGSGVAGLAAAQRLWQLGERDVLLLEAQARLGGRVHTIGHDNYQLELGAQWLHGAHENPLHGWLSQLDLLDGPQDGQLGFAGKFCTSPRADQPDSRLVRHVLEVLNKIKSALTLAASEQPNRAGAPEIGSEGRHLASAGQLFRRELEREMAHDAQLAANPELVEALFQWFMRYEAVENSCDSMSDVSIQSYTDWTDLAEGALLNFKRGYSSLLAWFCGQFAANEWIYLNTEALSVRLPASPNERLAVSYRRGADGASGGQRASQTASVECEHVLVTASIGFLKRNQATFFRPPLPKARQELINSMGFGTVNKIVLQFERPFWSEPSIKLVWTKRDDDEQPARFPLWTRDIISFDSVRGQPNLLVGWIGGQGAKLMERESDQTVGRICCQLLEQFLALDQDEALVESASRPRLLACVCSRWFSNPFTCGSYSFQSMQTRHLNVQQFHEPIYAPQDGDDGDEGEQHTNELLGAGVSSRRKPRILFAGEATAGKLYSTTHGAIISGWREAGRLAEHLGLELSEPVAPVELDKWM